MQKAARPRRYAGGRSERYDARRRERGATRAIAPGWSDVAAAAVLAGIEARGGGRSAAMGLLESSSKCQELLCSLELSSAEKAAAQEIMDLHVERYAQAESLAQRQAVAKGFLKPLRERQAAQGRAKALALPEEEVGARTCRSADSRA